MEDDNKKLVSAYQQAAEVIKAAILQGQYEAAKGINRMQLTTYFAIGKYVSANTRQGAWGTGALSAISERLQRLLPGLRGFSERNLKNMRLFYEEWSCLSNSAVATAKMQVQNNSAVATAETQSSDAGAITIRPLQLTISTDFPIDDFLRVPFTHHVEIFTRSKDIDERLYYIHRCAEEHMSVDRLKKAIAANDYGHQSNLPNNFAATISDKSLARKAVLQFKDSYLLNFINVEELGERDIEDIDERVVEQQIVHNIKKFIMTMGRDFAFIGNQYHLEAYDHEFFPDLLFFNRTLNAMVVVELKMGAFKPIYLSQLTTYLRILDDKVRKPHENPSIGIVLCKDADKKFVEYIIQDYNRPMGVATYKTADEMPETLRQALPNEEELKRLMEDEAEI